jgi:hypothetical protein
VDCDVFPRLPGNQVGNLIHIEFGIIENEKDEKGVPLEDFMFIST